MSVKEERQWEVGAAGVGLGLLGARSGLRGGCSFAEATPVTTSDGLKPIGELKIGDRVLARDEKTGAYAFEPITQVFRHRDPVEAHLTLEDPATGATEVIETTPNHPFHVPGRGFVEAAALKAGDPVSRALSDEPISTSGVAQLIADRSDLSDVLRVKTLTFENQPFWAYNLEVSKDHTFFVGATRAWVHNGPCPVELTPALMEQLAASRANLVTPRTATGVVAASPGQRGHSGQTNREGFPPSSDLMPQVLELAKQMGIPLKRSGASDNGVPGAFLAAHAEKQLALVADVFAVDTAMCAGCRQFVSNLSVAQGRTIIVQDPTRFGSSRRRAQSGSRFNGSTES